MKLHTLVDLRSNIAAFINTRNVKGHDVNGIRTSMGSGCVEVSGFSLGDVSVVTVSMKALKP